MRSRVRAHNRLARFRASVHAYAHRAGLSGPKCAGPIGRPMVSVGDEVSACLIREWPPAGQAMSAAPGGVPAEPGSWDGWSGGRVEADLKRLILAMQPGTPEGEGSRVNLLDGLAKPSRTDVGGHHAHRHSHPPGSGPQGPSKSFGWVCGCRRCSYVRVDRLSLSHGGPDPESATPPAKTTFWRS